MVCRCQRNDLGWRRRRVEKTVAVEIQFSLRLGRSFSQLPAWPPSPCPLVGGLGHGRERDLGRRPLCFDVLDARGSVHVQLTAALAEQELDGRKIALVKAHALVKLISTSKSEPRAFCLMTEWFLPGKRLEMRATGVGLLTTFSEALPVEAENLFLKA